MYLLTDSGLSPSLLIPLVGVFIFERGGGRPFFRRPSLAEFKLIIDCFPSRPEHQVRKRRENLQKSLILIKEDFLKIAAFIICTVLYLHTCTVVCCNISCGS
jgi:hypothetical protein